MSLFTQAQIEELHSLEQAGKLSPDSVIARAKKQTSPLHALFDWDKDRAALDSWRERAREIIRSVRVEVRYENSMVRVPAYVRDPQAAPEDQGYISIVRLRSEPALAHDALNYELERARSAFVRAREISQALGLEADVERLLQSLSRVQRKVEKLKVSREDRATV